jgi:hypothetical protein
VNRDRGGNQVKRNFRSMRYAFCLWLLLSGSHVFGGELNVRSYPLPDHGAIEFQVPGQWEDQLRQPPQRMPPTIEFRQKTGPSFKILITTMWAMNPSVTLPEGDELRKGVQKARDLVVSQAVEEKINLVELKGPTTYGYYFSATDRNPKPGGYKYLTQGHVRIDALMAIFTIFTNEGQESIVPEGLAMLKSAFHRRPSTPSPSKFFFDGNPTNEKLYNATGISVMDPGMGQIIILHNAKSRYTISLPYSRKWVFDLDGDHLKGNADSVSFDVQVWKGNDSALQSLVKLKESISSPSNPVPADKTEFVAEQMETVLRSEVSTAKSNPAHRDAKQYNFYSVKKSGDTLYKLQLSVVESPERMVPMYEGRLLLNVTKGFWVGDGPVMSTGK